MIEGVEGVHEIVGDEAPRGMRPDDLDLHAIVGGDLVGGETLEVEEHARGKLGRRWCREGYLVEGTELHRPEGIAPGFVQRLGRLVTPPDPVAEGGEIVRPVGKDRIVAAIFVVGLPTGYRRVLAIAGGDRGDD